MFLEPLGKSKFEFYAQLPDHTGNVGQFSMANEPSYIFHIYIITPDSLGKLKNLFAHY